MNTSVKLDHIGVEVRSGMDDGIWVAPEHACGATVYFFEE